MNALSLIVAAAICLPAMALAHRRSPWLVDYTIAVVAFNRGIRRVVDYANGEFDRTSPVILASLVVTAVAAFVTITDLQRAGRLGRIGRNAIVWYLTAISLAFVVGLVRNGLPALIELANFVGPLGMLGYGITFADSPKVLRQWARSSAWIGIAVAVYGLYQFYTIPPWDAFWVRAVEFEGYLGSLEPTKMTLYSTLAERGPAANFLAGTTILIMLRGGLLGRLRWPAASLTGYAMLLTYSRTTLIQVAVAAAALPFVSRRRVSQQMIPLVLAIVVASQVITAFSPVGGRISSRYGTLSNLAEDSSMQGRVALFFKAIPAVATNPFGFGFGSQGAAVRVAGGSDKVVMDSTAYLKIIQSFGWIGGFLIFRLLWQCWISSRRVIHQSPGDLDATFFRAWLVSGCVALISGNWLVGAMYFWCLAGSILGRDDRIVGAMTRQAVNANLPEPAYGLQGPALSRGVLANA